MLYHLHVKNLALIDGAELEFGRNLNILTGETGAGKSILIGSINLALGAKASRDMIRTGSDFGLVELVFGDLSEKQERLLAALDVYPEEGQIFIQRRITPSRSVIKINDELATVSKLRAVTELLIDLHGQHEHQSLLREGSHIRILDAFLGKEIGPVKKNLSEMYDAYLKAKQRLAGFDLNEAEKQRELDFLQFELEEIENADLREGEEESLAQTCRKYQHVQQILSGVSSAAALLEQAEISRAAGALGEAVRYDETLKPVSDTLYDAEAILTDVSRTLEAYLSSNDCDEEAFQEAETRLNQIRNVLVKYGGTVEKVQASFLEKQRRLQELLDYDQAKAACEKEIQSLRQKLVDCSAELTGYRKAGAERLCQRVRQELAEMGFLDVRFEMHFSPLSEPGRNGMDEAHFAVSLNPGEPLKPLTDVASGGELSRIMLSLKTVLADTDEIPTLIFDEIDTGISGMTAERVSDKLKKIAEKHQVICITHLPQIAAKADTHFEIEKSVSEGHTKTSIRKLGEEEQVMELARLLAGGRVTEAVIGNARELKKLAGERGTNMR